MTRKRHLTCVAALLVLVSSAFVGCRDEERRAREAAVVELPGPVAGAGAVSDPATAVRRVFEADEAFSARYVRVRHGDAAGWLAGQVAYARALQALSLNGTPEDFAEAFRRHQAAWTAYAAYLETVPSDRIGLFLDPGQARRPENVELARTASNLNKEISASWVQVEMIASTLGIGEGPSLRAPPAPVGSARKLIRSRQ
ncbi:MAG: hypothetical protein ABIK09_04120 [Pseudomonadota bacterium]